MALKILVCATDKFGAPVNIAIFSENSKIGQYGEIIAKQACAKELWVIEAQADKGTSCMITSERQDGRPDEKQASQKLVADFEQACGNVAVKSTGPRVLARLPDLDVHELNQILDSNATPRQRTWQQFSTAILLGVVALAITMAVWPSSGKKVVKSATIDTASFHPTSPTVSTAEEPKWMNENALPTASMPSPASKQPNPVATNPVIVPATPASTSAPALSSATPSLPPAPINMPPVAKAANPAEGAFIPSPATTPASVFPPPTRSAAPAMTSASPPATLARPAAAASAAPVDPANEHVNPSAAPTFPSLPTTIHVPVPSNPPMMSPPPAIAHTETPVAASASNPYAPEFQANRAQLPVAVNANPYTPEYGNQRQETGLYGSAMPPKPATTNSTVGTQAYQPPPRISNPYAQPGSNIPASAYSATPSSPAVAQAVQYPPYAASMQQYSQSNTAYNSANAAGAYPQPVPATQYPQQANSYAPYNASQATGMNNMNNANWQTNTPQGMPGYSNNQPYSTADARYGTPVTVQQPNYNQSYPNPNYAPYGSPMPATPGMTMPASSTGNTNGNQYSTPRQPYDYSGSSLR